MSSLHSPPLPQNLHIVALETYAVPLPPLTVPAPHTFTLTTYEQTTAEQVSERIAGADIIITSIVPLRADVLNKSSLRLVSVVASGTDCIDLDVCAARGIRVLNSPHCNTQAMAEHVAALYFGLRRSFVPIMRAMTADEWPQKGSLMKVAYNNSKDSTGGKTLTKVMPRSCGDETVAILGYGGVGQAVAKVLGQGLGMKVVVAGRRGQEVTAAPRIPFDDALRQATVVVVCCPRLPDTLNLIGERELGLLRPDALVINVSRGGIVSEQGLVDALRAGRLAGAGVDVFDQEPASTATSPLVAAAAADEESASGADRLNLLLTAHTAWLAASTMANYQRVLQENIEQFITGTVSPERVKA